jgi:tRNA A37 threonylcarbamoyladenosine modification protein TsaB
MNTKKIVLAIETGFAGGSISLLRNNVEIDKWSGSRAISKSEDVLDEISILLKKNKIERFEISSILISKKVGSLTGLRIGLALARGLSKSLNCQYKETPS